MEIEKTKSAIEAILFASAREVKKNEIMAVLEINAKELEEIIENMKENYQNRGIELITVDDGYQLITKKEYYEFIYPIIDKRVKPNLSNAALETLSIIAYNPKITRAEIETIRGVGTDGTIYKLLEYHLIEEAGKLEAPGRPTTYKTTNEFLKMFGLNNLDELPELPKYKLDENQQIVIDEQLNKEAPEPAREEQQNKTNNEETNEK